MNSKRARLLCLLACAGLAGGSLGQLGCGSSSGNPADAGGDAPGDHTTDGHRDAGTDAKHHDAAKDSTVDSGPDVADVTSEKGDGADACGAVTLVSITPTQGWNGLDVTATIGGTGFVVCGAVAGEAGAEGGAEGGVDAGPCVDQFTLTGFVCPASEGGVDAAMPDGGDGGDGGEGGTAEAGSCEASVPVSYPLTTVTVPDTTTAIVTIPAGGPIGGPYTLTDTRSGCTYSLPNAYTILGATVNVAMIIPPYGWTGADTPVTIVGSGFISTPHGLIDVPSMTPALQPLRDTAFVSATSLTSIVPKGLTAGGPYDVDILNPDGTGGTLKAAFKVVSLPIPSISGVSPSSLTTSQLGATDNVTITGCNFRDPLTISTIDSTGASVAQTEGTLTCSGAATCPGGTNVCTLTATIGAGLATGAYVVQVTDNDQGTSGEYSALVITNPSAKLATGFVTSSSLNVGRRSLVSTTGEINDASRFLYAIGGEDATGTALSSVEVAPLDLFGTTGTWFVQRNALNVARSGASVVQQGSYIYVLGGTSSKGGTGGATPSGTALATIERAKILDLTDIPTLNDPTTSKVGTLAAGSWYYKVSVVKDASDPDNPSGEGLPSDEVVATLTAAGSVSLSWTAPSATAHIAHYRIYRSAKPDGMSQSEVFLADTATAATLTYTDDGSVAPGAQTPLQRGSTGVWVTQTGTLNTARLDANATIAPDPTGQLYAYVTGGYGTCPGSATVGVMTCYEFAQLSSDGSTLGAFTNGTQAFVTPRARHGVGAMTAANGITPWLGNAAFIFLSGGMGTTTPSTHIEYAVVNTGGQVGAWTETGVTQFALTRDGSQLQVANGYLYAFLGGNPGAYSSSVDLESTVAETAATITLGVWSNASSATPSNVGRMGVTLQSAYFYVIGGTSNDADALTSVYQIIY